MSTGGLAWPEGQSLHGLRLQRVRRPAGWLALHLIAPRWNPDPREMDFIGQCLPAPLVGFFRCHRQSFRQQPNEKTDPRPRIFPRCLLSPSRRCLGQRELRGGTGKSLGGYYSDSFRERLICQGRHVMHQLSIQRHPCAIVRDETHRIDRHLGLLRNEPWQGHANNASVKPVQDGVHRLIGMPIRPAKTHG